MECSRRAGDLSPSAKTASENTGSALNGGWNEARSTRRSPQWNVAPESRWAPSPLATTGRLRAAVLQLVILLLAGPALAAPMVYIDFGGAGSSTSVGLGGTATANVYATDIPAGAVDPVVGGPGMFGFGFDITFNSVGLEASNLAFGSLFTATGFSSTVDDPGRAGLTSNRFFMTNGPSGDDIFLGSIDFEGLSGGVYGLTLGYFTGAGDNTLFDSTILDTAPGTFFTTGSITVIPEPGTATLLLVGMALMSGVRRR